jgi:hypothetical protein
MHFDNTESPVTCHYNAASVTMKSGVWNADIQGRGLPGWGFARLRCFEVLAASRALAGR